MKRILVALLTVLCLAVTAGAVDLYVDTVKIETDSPPTIIDGRTLVPVRAIFEALGAEVSWDQATQTATGVKDDTTVAIQIGNKTAYVNGVAKTLDVPAQIINGRTMVPARFVSESLDATVYWNQETQSVRVSKQLYTVLRVKDGDTIVVDFNGTEETVRLIGVDTPESVHPDADRNTEAGITASEYTKSKLDGKQVELEFDVQQRDMYGRLLAYVYVDGAMFNKTLLKDGIANMATYPPNVKYVDDFTKIVSERNPGTIETPQEKPEDKPADSTTSNTVGHSSGSYIASLDSDKYHKPSCRYAKKITAENVTWFVSEEEAMSVGYSPCGVCKP